MSTNKSKKKKKIVKGIAHIKSTFNNTIISITDENGSVLSWSSTGMVGFKGTKKGTPYAAQMSAASAAKKVVDQYGMERVVVVVKGPGAGRETAIRALQSSGLDVESIKDVTPLPYNGCRPRKRRRV